MSKPKIVVHDSKYLGNARSPAHIATEYSTATGQWTELCEVDVRIHASFTPGHLAMLRFLKEKGRLDTFLTWQKHVENDHSDGSVCPVTEDMILGHDWSEVATLYPDVVCKKGA